MQEGITLASIAAIAAKAAIGTLASMPIKAGVGKAKKGVARVLPRSLLTGPVERALEKALEEANFAFLSNFKDFADDPQVLADLQAMVEDSRWTESVAQLVSLHPAAIDTRKCERLYLELGPSACRHVDYFTVGWQRLTRRFEKAVAASDSAELRNFVAISASTEAFRQLGELVELSRQHLELQGFVIEIGTALVRLYSAKGIPLDDEPATREYLETIAARYRHTSMGEFAFREGAGRPTEHQDIFVEPDLGEQVKRSSRQDSRNASGLRGEARALRVEVGRDQPSGRVSLRVRRSLHEQLTRMAKYEEVDVHQLINSALEMFANDPRGEVLAGEAMARVEGHTAGAKLQHWEGARSFHKAAYRLIVTGYDQEAKELLDELPKRHMSDFFRGLAYLRQPSEGEVEPNPERGYELCIQAQRYGLEFHEASLVWECIPKRLEFNELRRRLFLPVLGDSLYEDARRMSASAKLHSWIELQRNNPIRVEKWNRVAEDPRTAAA